MGAPEALFGDYWRLWIAGSFVEGLCQQHYETRTHAGLMEMALSHLEA